MDNTVHRINRYHADSVVCFVDTSLLDSDLSSLRTTEPGLTNCFEFSSIDFPGNALFVLGIRPRHIELQWFVRQNTLKS